MTLRYVTGTARAVVRGGTVVVLPGPVEASLVEQVWDQLGADAGVVEVLQVLTGAFGSSLRTVPPFVVAVVTDRRVHVAARGRVSVTLELDGGERVRVDGEGVTTWSERVLEVYTPACWSGPVSLPGKPVAVRSPPCRWWRPRQKTCPPISPPT